MKNKLIISGLVLSSFIGYLEWGKDSKSFLIQAELEVLSKIFTDPASVVHPFTLVPLMGQILLLITLFQKKPSRLLAFIGIGSIGILLLFMFFIGILSFNLKILASTIPFIVLCFAFIKINRRGASKNL
jgi:type IV secretory pathway VirB6-like protein